MGYNKGLKRGVLIGFLISFILFVSIVSLAYVAKPSIFSSSLSNKKDSETVKLIKEVDYYLDKEHLYDIKTRDAMTDEALRGYISGMGDKYAKYYSKKEYRELMQDIGGKYTGIGITIHYDAKNSVAQIEGVTKGASGYKVGIKKGDIILRISGKVVTKDNLNELIKGIRESKIGTPIDIDIKRGKDELKFTPIVSQIEKQNVYSQMIGDILYIALDGFDEVTHKQLVDEYNKYSSKKKNGIILDLRYNPGGDLQSVLDIAGEIVPEKLIAYTENKNRDLSELTTKTTQSIKEPMCVLVNDNTASAAELLTGAIKDYKRGTIIGTRTFGKGVVQIIRDLKNGGGFKHTIQKYLTPNKYDLNEKGIYPDIEVKPDQVYKELKDQAEVKKALEILNKK